MTERTYRIQVAAELSGVSEGLLRAWERRYGALKPRRSANGYRGYTAADIEALKALKQLTVEGLAIAEAVKQLPAIRKALRAEHRGSDAPSDDQLERWRSRVLAAAEAHDQQLVEQVLLEAMLALAPLTFLDALLMPLLREVGDRWHAGTLTVAQEHLVTQCARQGLVTLLQQAPKKGRHQVLCACFPEEEHDLALLGVALRFRHAGWKVTSLGARTPFEQLGKVARALRPELVALSAITTLGPRSFEAAIEEVLALLPKGTSLVIGGTGALAHEALATARGVRLIRRPGEWEALLA